MKKKLAKKGMSSTLIAIMAALIALVIYILLTSKVGESLFNQLKSLFGFVG